jgi:microcystin-dependent protein
MTTPASALPALPPTADTRSITERVNVLIRDYNNPIAQQRLVPSGTVLPFAGTTAPTGFLLCSGQAVSRSTYSDLFAAIGTTYGAGDGSTTFNVPDLRGRVPAGKDDMGGGAAGRLTSGGSGLAGTTLGATGGAETQTLNAGQMPAHNHGVNDPTHGHGAPGGRIVIGDASILNQSWYSYADGGNIQPSTANSGTGISIQNAGGGAAHNNTQPTLILNHIIST